MSLSHHILLSRVVREKTVASIKQLPDLIYKEVTVKDYAAVLVPLCVHNGEMCLLYTLRSTNLKSHSGQVSFPGGKMDENENVVETALRETEEEIGVSKENIDIWGEMPKFQGRNKEMIITPVIGEIRNFDFSKLTLSVNEVEEVFTVPMAAFCDTNNHAYLEFNNTVLPIFMYGKHKIWGITGYITHLFLGCFLSSDDYKVDFLRKKFEIDELMPSKL